MLFDTHAHLNDPIYSDDFDEVITRMKDEGVNKVLIASYDIESSLNALKIAGRIEGAVCSIGIHPHDALSFDKKTYEILYKTAVENKETVKAIGEIGLDYYRDLSPRDAQKEAFIRQIKLAKDLDLPVIIHNRDAHEDVINILTQAHKDGLLREMAGVFHCFSGSFEIARIAMDLGFYISFAGPVTFKNASKTVDVMRKIPQDRIFIETDCPYLTPEPHRGTRNEPSYVKYVAKKYSELMGISFEEAAEITTRNAMELFNITA